MRIDVAWTRKPTSSTNTEHSVLSVLSVFVGGSLAVSLMSPKEVVAFLSARRIYVIDDTVRAWTTRGVSCRTQKGKRTRKVLKSDRVGGRILISRVAVERFIPSLVHVQE